MLFSSLEFIFLFLPLTLAVYFLTPTRFKNLVLLLSGLAFYAFGEPKFLPVMMLTVVADFLFGIWIARLGDKKRAASRVLVLAVAYNIGQLAFFKYFNFLGIGLPIGIKLITSDGDLIEIYGDDLKINKQKKEFPHEFYGKACYGMGHAPLISDFYDCVQTGRKFPIDGKEGQKALRIVLSAYESEGKRIKIK